MPPIIEKEKCINCGTCVQICPLDVFRYTRDASGEKHATVKYPYECWHCRACVKDCPEDAIYIRYPLSHMMFTMEIPEKAEDKGGAAPWK